MAPLLPTSTTPTPSTALAYLDGLRGIAALIVYNHHHITDYYGNDADIMHSWGYAGRHHFAQLPFLQLFFAGGTPAVMLFFVLSGYVLTKQYSKRAMISAIIRRPIRLWLPPILVSLPVAILFHIIRPLGFIMLQPNVLLELKAYFISLIETINPFIGHGPFLQSFAYDPPVWTMAYELNGSYLIYALSYTSSIPLLAVITFLCFEFLHFSTVPFMLGAILTHIKTKPRVTDNALFIIGWYLLSDIGPVVKSEHPWFGLPANWVPYFFYHNTNLATNIIGATFVVYAALRLEWLQKLLNRAQWLGRVSFALYLTHIPVLWFFATRVRRALSPGETGELLDSILPLPDIGPQGLSTRYLAMQLIVLPLNLLLAEVVTVWIDEPSVKASKHVATKIMQKLHLS